MTRSRFWTIAGLVGGGIADRMHRVGRHCSCRHIEDLTYIDNIGIVDLWVDCHHRTDRCPRTACNTRHRIADPNYIRASGRWRRIISTTRCISVWHIENLSGVDPIPKPGICSLNGVHCGAALRCNSAQSITPLDCNLTGTTGPCQHASSRGERSGQDCHNDYHLKYSLHCALPLVTWMESSTKLFQE